MFSFRYEQKLSQYYKVPSLSEGLNFKTYQIYAHLQVFPSREKKILKGNETGFQEGRQGEISTTSLKYNSKQLSAAEQC